MTSDEIRAAFLSFFESKGHKVIPSDSLIPHGDPTLLLTSAGMVQFKPYFLGETVPPGPRLASCQKCFRANDIESVGDSTHLTFFEMLGNFSVGDYFKKETIAWAWEFLTQWLKLPPERLWISIFLDDDEAFQYWREIGIPEERILRLSEEDNFWGPAGDSGPCGPDSEIFYDFGEEVGCGKHSCAPGCDCGRFPEIWNLVFPQYNQDKEGNRTLLPKPSIDTGMGMERITAVMQGKTSVYETDLFTPLLECVSELVGKKYGVDDVVDNAMRVVAEHSRGIAFLIGDGVIPGKDGRGYVLRRLLRRAAVFGRRVGMGPFLKEVVWKVTEQMKHVYPELEKRRDFVLEVVGHEETRFDDAVITGLELLDGIMDRVANGVENTITGFQAFELHDTFGLPVEITVEIAAGRGFAVDMEGFEREMEKQREKARASHRFELADRAYLESVFDFKATPFVGYDNLNEKTIVAAIVFDGESVNSVDDGQEAGLVLEKTPFYAEMGGQVGDRGKINGGVGTFEVSDTVSLKRGVIIHQGKVSRGVLTVGDAVEVVVDEERRLDIARNHTATHLLQVALRQVLGGYVQQRGSLVAPNRLRFDFSHLIALTGEEIVEVQRIVNDSIRQNLVVHDEEMSYKQAIEEGAIALFDEKYDDVVRVLRIGRPSISVELCGGTHVANTGEIGSFHIISESSIGAGLRRIEVVTGREAEVLIGRRLSDLAEIAEELDVELDNVLDKVHSLSIELKNERRQTLALERELARKVASSLLNQVEEVDGIKVLATRISPSRIQNLREMSDLLREQLGSALIVLGTVYQDKPLFLAAVTPDLVAKGYNAGQIVKQVAAVTGGGGGGKATLAQAGGRDKGKLDEALRLVKNLI